MQLLRSAYSGELAAAYAYRGHWHSVKDSYERERIRQIEEDEWHHRMIVGAMLKEVGAKPFAYRELRSAVIGRIVGLSCNIVGWFLPMYVAGKLESKNVKEYEDAARRARESGHLEFISSLLEMARIEWDHESFFRSRIEGHPMTLFFPLWDSLPPRETIGKSFIHKS